MLLQHLLAHLQVAVDADVAPVANLLGQVGGVAAQAEGQSASRVRRLAEAQADKAEAVSAARPGAGPHMMYLGLKKVYLRFLVRKPRSRARLKS